MRAHKTFPTRMLILFGSNSVALFNAPDAEVSLAVSIRALVAIQTIRLSAVMAPLKVCVHTSL